MGEGGGARLARVIEVIDDIMLGARDVTQRGSLFPASFIAGHTVRLCVRMIAASRHSRRHRNVYCDTAASDESIASLSRRRAELGTRISDICVNITCSCSHSVTFSTKR